MMFSAITVVWCVLKEYLYIWFIYSNNCNQVSYPNFSLYYFVLIYNSYHTIKAGGAAGLVVDIVLFPIDTVKTRLQSEKGFWRSGGFRGIYNGLAPAAVGSVPSAAIFFCTYESVKSVLLANTRQEYAPLVHMSSASVAEAVSKRVFKY